MTMKKILFRSSKVHFRHGKAKANFLCSMTYENVQKLLFKVRHGTLAQSHSSAQSARCVVASPPSELRPFLSSEASNAARRGLLVERNCAQRPLPCRIGSRRFTGGSFEAESVVSFPVLSIAHIKPAQLLKDLFQSGRRVGPSSISEAAL